jgi:hypothetical protein
MNKPLRILLTGLLLLCGCARHYVITMSNGSQIGTRSKPQFKNGVYVFKDANGNESYVPAGRVTEIAPASSTPSKPDPFIPQPSR